MFRRRSSSWVDRICSSARRGYEDNASTRQRRGRRIIRWGFGVTFVACVGVGRASRKDSDRNGRQLRFLRCKSVNFRFSKIQNFGSLLIDSFNDWQKNNALRLSAALAYY